LPKSAALITSTWPGHIPEETISLDRSTCVFYCGSYETHSAKGFEAIKAQKTASQPSPPGRVSRGGMQEGNAMYIHISIYIIYIIYYIILYFIITIYLSPLPRFPRLLSPVQDLDLDAAFYLPSPGPECGQEAHSGAGWQNAFLVSLLG